VLEITTQTLELGQPLVTEAMVVLAGAVVELQHLAEMAEMAETDAF
jgi:hypothetical protein